MGMEPYRDREGAAITADGYPLAYLITFRCYGTWLHGDERGSMDRHHCVPGGPLVEPDMVLLRRRGDLLKHEPVRFGIEAREVVDRAIREVCGHKEWKLYALNVRTNHVHVVVSTLMNPERVMTAFKAWSTRRLREQSVLATDVKPWSRHGSTRYLWNEASVAQACEYTELAQGAELAVQKVVPPRKATP